MLDDEKPKEDPAENIRRLLYGISKAPSEPSAEIIVAAKTAGDWMAQLQKNGFTREEAFTIVIGMFPHYPHH